MAKQTFTTGQVLTAAQLTSLQQTAMLGGAASAKTASYTLVAADAGTTISMTSTSATTITVNTGLFAAGDTVFIQNLGSGNLTITAGSATVATAGSLILPQNDAGILYFVSTSSSVFYDFIQVGATSPLTTKGDLYTFSTSDTRLGVGANGTTLVADSSEATGLKWQAPTGAGSSWSLLNAGGTALTAASSITVSGISGVDKVLVLIDTASAVNASSEFKFLINSNTGSVYGRFGGMTKATSTASDIMGVQTGFDTALYFATSTQSRADGVVAGSLFITGANSAGRKSFATTGGANGPGSNVGHIGTCSQGIFDSTSTVSSVTVTSGNGNFDSGTIYVYTSVS